MVSCKETGEMLSALVDGELDEGERVSLEEHLQSCRPCQDLKDRFETMNRLLTGSNTKPKPGLEKRIGKALQPAGSKSTGRLLRVAAAALVLIAISLVITVMSDRADADWVKERMDILEAMNAETLNDQEAMLKTFEWELSALRIMVNYSDLEASQIDPILVRIDRIMNEIERVRQKEKP